MEIDYYWEALTSEGGQESVCGWLYLKQDMSQ
ncbi:MULTISPECIES: VOC family protein [Sphingobacterium]